MLMLMSLSVFFYFVPLTLFFDLKKRKKMSLLWLGLSIPYSLFNHGASYFLRQWRFQFQWQNSLHYITILTFSSFVLFSISISHHSYPQFNFTFLHSWIVMQARDTLGSLNADFGFGGSDRRFAFSRQASFHQQQPRSPIPSDLNDLGSRKPFLSRTDSSIDIPSSGSHHHYWSSHDEKPSGSPQISSFSSFVFYLFRNIRSGHRYMKRLFLMISLNVAYSTVELLIGLFTGRVGKIQRWSIELNFSPHFKFS